jgi:membrane protease YdiL (CAAX protease family)
MPPLFANKSSWLQLLYLLLFITCGVIIFGALSVLIGQLSVFASDSSRFSFYVMQSITSFGMFFAPAILFSYCTTKKWFSYSAVGEMVPVKFVGYVLILSLLILPVVACLSYFNEQITFPESMQNIEEWMRKMEEVNKLALRALTANSTLSILLLNIVVMAIFPALFEEFLFRGALQPFFTKWFKNKRVAILVTAFIFSAIHFQFYGFIPRFLLGIYLGYLLVWSKSLWLPIVAHFMHNSVTLILDYGAQQQGIDLETIEPGQIQWFYPFVIFCAVCVGIGVYYLRKNIIRIIEN